VAVLRDVVGPDTVLLEPPDDDDDEEDTSWVSSAELDDDTVRSVASRAIDNWTGLTTVTDASLSTSAASEHSLRPQRKKR